ncbi:sulfatase-like hydrolase/transferase [Salinilacihabitans rarus]|uniref:sulfatase-like hydrolase/transferase n=1 Tax=Salinilacihabitans rarus TaxID=2961596 RepID=UPI0020C8CC76|nr:sulfatase-like hydrolase/transferase [Salinilacihabitans rarus]
MELNVREWLKQLRTEWGQNPRRAPLYAFYVPYLGMWYSVTSRYPVGTNVYDKDWDVLVVLDACRTDSLRQLSDEYDFLAEIDSVRSVGSQSGEWIANTFREDRLDDVENTVMVTANGFARRILADRRFPPFSNNPPVQAAQWTPVYGSDFEDLQFVWEDHHDPDLGVVPPRVVTDYAIEAARETQPERLVVHYLQPHRPYIADAAAAGRRTTEVEREGYEVLERGEASRDEIYSMYMDNLRYVLDDVELLLENVDAETVAITADHGESFGEGFAYGHPEGFLHPVVKRVPWVETTAADTGSYTPEISAHEDLETDIESHLQDLGYM